MNSDRLIQLVEDIQSNGGKAYLVGGCVRDHLMKLPSSDRDLEVFGIEPKVLKKICHRHGKVSTVGASFAVLKVTFPNRETVDVSLPRRETQVGVGHKSFEIEADPEMSLDEAARRRDLTINAISMNPLTHEIIDPCNGLADLDLKLLRHVGPRFREDPLRVLRVIQFAGRFGFSIAEETFTLCTQMIQDGDVLSLPRERIEEEFRKLFVKGKSSYIRDALQHAFRMGIFRSLLPELHHLHGIEQDPRYHAEGDVLTHSILTVENAARIAERDGLDDGNRHILCLAALMHDLGKIHTTQKNPDGTITAYGHDKESVLLAEKLLTRLTGNQQISANVRSLVAMHMRPLQLATAEHVTDGAIRRLAQSVLPSNLTMLAYLVEADTLSSYRSGDVPAGSDAHTFLLQRAVSLGVQTIPPKPIMQGRDLIRLAEQGRLPIHFKNGGSHFGVILSQVFDAQLEGRVSSIEEAEILALRIHSTGIENYRLQHP